MDGPRFVAVEELTVRWLAVERNYQTLAEAFAQSPSAIKDRALELVQARVKADQLLASLLSALLAGVDVEQAHVVPGSPRAADVH